MTQEKSKVDPISALQDHFGVLGKAYVDALRQNASAGPSANEPDLTAQDVWKLVVEALLLVDRIPEGDTSTSMEALVQENAALRAELTSAKAQAQDSIKRIKRLRVEVAQLLIPGMTDVDEAQ